MMKVKFKAVYGVGSEGYDIKQTETDGTQLTPSHQIPDKMYDPPPAPRAFYIRPPYTSPKQIHPKT